MECPCLSKILAISKLTCLCFTCLFTKSSACAELGVGGPTLYYYAFGRSHMTCLGYITIHQDFCFQGPGRAPFVLPFFLHLVFLFHIRFTGSPQRLFWLHHMHPASQGGLCAGCGHKKAHGHLDHKRPAETRFIPATYTSTARTWSMCTWIKSSYSTSSSNFHCTVFGR